MASRRRYCAISTWLSTKFPEKQVFIDYVLANILTFANAAASASKHDGERAREEAEQALLQSQIRDYVKDARLQARRVINNIKSDPNQLANARALAASLGLNSRLSLTRNGELNQLLTKTAATHNDPTLRALLQSWGSDDDFLNQAQILVDALPVQTAELRTEQHLAETATASRDALRSIVITQTNKIINAVEVFAPTKNPELFQKVSSVLNKHRSVLTAHLDDTAADEPADDTDDATDPKP